MVLASLLVGFASGCEANNAHGARPEAAGGSAGASPVASCASADDCLGRELANWPMPNSGSLPLPNSPKLVVEAGQVHDQVTGLVWTRDYGELMNFDAARSFCVERGVEEGLSWRLPTRVELVSILEHTRTPSVDEASFPNTPRDYFWSRSPAPADGALRYSVYFGLGETAHGDEATAGAYARCVRAGARAPKPEFETTPNVARSSATGLGWQRRAPLEPVGLEAARLACEALSLEGSSDFRVPTAKELQTLVYVVSSTPEASLLDGEAFAGEPPGSYWSEGGSAETPMKVDFMSGSCLRADRFEENHVRCVTEIQ